MSYAVRILSAHGHEQRLVGPWVPRLDGNQPDDAHADAAAEEAAEAWAEAFTAANAPLLSAVLVELEEPT